MRERFEQAGFHAYCLLAFVVGVVAVSPLALMRISGAEAEFLVAKVVVLLAAVVVGLITWMLGAEDIGAHNLATRLYKATADLKILGLAVIAALVSSWFAISPVAVSLLGSPVRWDGSAITALWWCLVPLSFLLGRRHASSRVGIMVSYAAVGMALGSAVTLVQAYGLYPLHVLNSEIPPAFADLLGNASLASIFAGVGVVLFGLLAVFLAASWRQRAVLVVALLASGAVGATGGRSAQVGIGLVWILALAHIYLHKKKFIRRFVWISIAMLLTFTVTALSSGVGRWKLASYQAVVEGSNGSLNARIVTWKAGVAAILQRPFFGYGADMAAVTVWQYVTPGEAHLLYRQFMTGKEARTAVRYGSILFYKDDKTGKTNHVVANYDKAHNYFIDLGLANGLIVLVSFFVAVTVMLYRMVRARSSVAQAIGLALAFFLISELAWFASIVVDPYVWALVGVGLAAVGHSPGDQSPDGLGTDPTLFP